MTGKLKKPASGIGCLARDQRGLGLVEALVALAILGTSVVAFAVALSTGTIAIGEQDKEVVAQALAQTQLEFTKSCDFSPGASTYPMVAVPSGYTVNVGVVPVPGAGPDIQKITVSVLRDGQNVLTVQDYKVNR
jgi:Tfp pilus assembly protein PilV